MEKGFPFSEGLKMCESILSKAFGCTSLVGDMEGYSDARSPLSHGCRWSQWICKDNPPSNFHVEGFLLVVMWLPKTFTLCAFPGDRLIWSAWRFLNVSTHLWRSKVRPVREETLQFVQGGSWTQHPWWRQTHRSPWRFLACAQFFTCQSSCRW